MIVLVTGRHRPHELLLLAVSVLLGTSYLVRVPAPQTLTASVPRWVVILWAVGLVASGIIGLTGCLWRGDITTGLGLERGAMLMSTGVMALMAAVVVSATGIRGLFTASITIAWALANLYRVAQITTDLRRIDVAHEEDADG